MPPLDTRLRALEKRLDNLETRANVMEEVQRGLLKWLARTSRCVRWAWGVLGPFVLWYVLRYFGIALPPR